MILILFHLFCMFHDYWRIEHRSQDSAEKAPSECNISEDQQLTEITRKILFFQKTELAKRRSRGGPPWAPHRPARAQAWPRRLVGRGPTAPSGLLSFAYFFVPKT